MEQMMIFDLMGFDYEDKIDTFEGLTLHQIAEIVTNRTGLVFKYDADYDRYNFRNKDLDLSFSLSAMIVESHRPFISFDYLFRRRPDHYGGGLICDSIEELIRDIKEKQRQCKKQ